MAASGFGIDRACVPLFLVRAKEKIDFGGAKKKFGTRVNGQTGRAIRAGVGGS